MTIFPESARFLWKIQKKSVKFRKKVLDFSNL